MATTTATTIPPRTVMTTTTAICGCTTEETELIARAECFLRLEEQSENTMLLLAKRREEEQDKIFKTLCAATELTVTKLNETWKTYDTATVLIETDAAVVTKFQSLVSERITLFAQANPEVFRCALEKRRKTLGDQLNREQQDTLVVEKRIALVEKRLADLNPPEPQKHGSHAHDAQQHAHAEKSAAKKS
jgi:hypothetical protein